MKVKESYVDLSDIANPVKSKVKTVKFKVNSGTHQTGDMLLKRNIVELQDQRFRIGDAKSFVQFFTVERPSILEGL